MNSSFQRWHLWVPLLAFSLVFLILVFTGLDHWLANTLYFDVPTGQWLGSGAGDWWSRGLLHRGGRWVVRAVAAAAILVWVLSFALTELRSWRAEAGFVALALLLSVGLVGGLKAVTNVDCPWDLVGYGGHNPDVALFANRPDYLPRARCFPGAHASSGFALLCFYFLWRDRAPRLAHWGLALGVLVGVVFSIGQEARGAHFLSHDLASAAIVWFVQLGLYLWLRVPERGVEKSGAPVGASHSVGSGWRRVLGPGPAA